MTLFYLKRLFLSLLFLLSIPRTALSDGETDRPVLLLLMGTAGAPALEEEFRAELALRLETHVISVKSPFSFVSANPAQRIEEIRPLVKETGAEMVVWIERMDSGKFALQIVSAAPGRAISRSVEISPGDTAASELAVSTRELVEEFYAGSPAGTGAPVTDEPQSSPVAPEEKHPIGSIGLGFDIASGIAGGEGPTLVLGGEVAGMLRFRNGIHLQASVTGFGAPDPSIPDAAFATGGVRPGLGFGWLRDINRFALGPSVAVEAPWQRAAIKDGDGPEITHDWWNVRFLLSLEMRLRVARRLQIGLRPGLGLSTNSKVFESEDGTVIYASPIFDWNARLSLIVDVN